jgi:hypothetical protein
MLVKTNPEPVRKPIVKPLLNPQVVKKKTTFESFAKEVLLFIKYAFIGISTTFHMTPFKWFMAIFNIIGLIAFLVMYDSWIIILLLVFDALAILVYNLKIGVVIVPEKVSDEDKAIRDEKDKYVIKLGKKAEEEEKKEKEQKKEKPMEIRREREQRREEPVKDRYYKEEKKLMEDYDDEKPSDHEMKKFEISEKEAEKILDDWVKD